jgi:uncharacterized protein YrrD
MMLFRMQGLIGMSIRASDGEIGSIKDVYFDDHRWTARYLVVDTGTWLEGRKVLISPIAVDSIDWNTRTVQITLTGPQVKASPPVDTDKPVSQQHEADFLGYYGYPNWRGRFMWGTTSSPHPVKPTDSAPPTSRIAGTRAEDSADPHLRSVKEVSGYYLETSNAPMGSIEDFLVDHESWAIRYIVVHTGNWWPAKHVVISPQWITRVDWAERQVTVDVTRAAVQGAPEYDPTTDYSRAHESTLYRHYQRPGYWQ